MDRYLSQRIVLLVFFHLQVSFLEFSQSISLDVCAELPVIADLVILECTRKHKNK